MLWHQWRNDALQDAAAIVRKHFGKKGEACAQDILSRQMPDPVQEKMRSNLKDVRDRVQENLHDIHQRVQDNANDIRNRVAEKLASDPELAREVSELWARVDNDEQERARASLRLADKLGVTKPV